jgi:2-enoate reductase
MNENHRILFSAAKIGACEVKNRFVMAPMGPAGLADAQGSFTQGGINFYVERAKGGVGLIIAGMCYVENTVERHGPGTMPCPTMSPVLFKRTAKQLTERVHAYGTKIFLQISAGFGRVTNRIPPGDLPIAPSPIPYRWDPSITCRAISTDEVQEIVRAMGRAAVIAQEAGFDGVEIHAMHEGYLLDQFAMECCNWRTDQYGGNLENRIRMAVEIVKEIKEACGARFPVVMRYSTKSFMKDFGAGGLPGEKFQEMGRDMDEGLRVAKMLEQAGYDALDADVGCYDSWYWNHPPMYFEKGLYLPYNEELKRSVSIPVLTAGRMDDAEMAAAAIAQGKTDLVSMARPLLADAALVQKLYRGTPEDVRPCISCQEACIGRLKKYLHISCAVNPSAAREREMALTPAAAPRRVAVLGGGVAGCEAARVLALRGHKPEIFERSGQLGGNVRPASAPDFKEDERKLIAWYEKQISDLKVPVHFGAEVSSDTIPQGFDVYLVATGSRPVTFKLGDGVPVFTAAQILQGEVVSSGPYAVVGGGLVGCETALMLARQGEEVSIVEGLPAILGQNGPLCYANAQMLKDLIAFHKVAAYTGSMADHVDAHGLVITSGGEKRHIAANTVILSVGYRSECGLYGALQDAGEEVYLLGDARRVSNIMYAIWDAYEVASQL